MKVCSKCNMEKEFEEFQSEKRKSDGRSARCKSCLNEDKRQQLDKRRDKIREYNRKKYYEDHENQKSLRTERSRKYRKENPEGYLKYHNEWYWKNAEKVRARVRELNKRPEARAKEREYTRTYRTSKAYGYKDKSRNIYEQALKWGFLTRPTQCEICMKECKPDGHHTDYSKPLEVQWLCKICHAQQHGKLMDVKP